MSNRIEEKFINLGKENKKALVCFITSGDPNLSISEKILSLLSDGGADIIEIGLPFSDPMADGPTIQKSSQRAIKQGANIFSTLEMVNRLRKKDNVTPIILMGYFNPMFQFGLNKFFLQASKVGVDGLIIVDLPPEENELVEEISRKFKIDIIRLLTPTTDKNRLKRILKSTTGFLYYISIMGITGTKKPAIQMVNKAVKQIKKNTNLPVVVGFGINNSKQVKDINKIADGCVIGSVLVRIIEDFSMGKISKEKMYKNLNNFLQQIKKAC